MKRCSRCGETKPPSEFGRNRRKKDGLHYLCRDCHNAANKVSYARHIESERAKHREYGRANRDKAAARMRKWRALNPEKAKEASYRHQKASIARNPQPHREQVRRAMARRRARLRGLPDEPFDRREIYDRWGGVCHICGLAVDFDAMHLDHIVPVAAGGGTVPDNLAPAHPKCNWAKGGRLLDPEPTLPLAI